MTVQEAIEILKKPIEYAKISNVDDEEEITYSRDFVKAIEIAIECMEKQIPKSPTLEGDGYCPEGNLVYDTWICPNCDKDYEIDYDDYDYCPNCGQKIDKSEMGD